MKVRLHFFVTICVWQIIWSTNGLKLSISNVSSKSAPVKPSSKNTLSSSTGETSQASLLSNKSPTTSNLLSEEVISNGFNFPSPGFNIAPSAPSSYLNSRTSQNVISNSFIENESLNSGSSVFDPLYQSLLSSSTSNLEANDNNLLSAIRNSLNVQNNILPISPLANNGLLESLQNTGPSQTNLNKNVFSSLQKVNSLQSNLANLNIMPQKGFDSNLMNNVLSNTQNLGTISNIQETINNFEVTNNNLLSSIQNTVDAQSNKVLPLQSLPSPSFINVSSLQNIGSLSTNSFNNNLISSIQNPGLSTYGNSGISSLQNGLLETNSLNGLLSNSLNLESVPNNLLTQTLGPIQSNVFNSNLQLGTPQAFSNSINNNILATSNPGLLETSILNNNLIETSTNVGGKLANTLPNNYISSQNIGQLNNVQNADLNPYFNNLGLLQSNILNNIQNSQNIQSSQTETTSAQLLIPSFSPSQNIISNNFPKETNSDINSIKSSVFLKNNIVNSSPITVSNRNNDFINYLTANNLISSKNPSLDLINSQVANNVNVNPLLSEALSNKIALSESSLSVTNPFNNIASPLSVELNSQINPLTKGDLVSNYNKNILLQQSNNNVFENAILNNNNNILTQNLITNSDLPNSLQVNSAPTANLQNNVLLQNLLASKATPIGTTQSLFPNNIVNQNNMFGAKNQYLFDSFASNLKSGNVSNIGCYLYNDLMNKLQSPNPINNKISTEIDINNKNINTETSVSNNEQNTDYLSTISNTQASSLQASANILPNVNNLPRIPTSLPASFNYLINNNINNPKTANLEALTQTTTTPASVTEKGTPSILQNIPNTLNLLQNNFVPNYNNFINNNIQPQTYLGPILPESPPVGFGTPLNMVSSFKNTDFSESPEIKTGNTVSSSYPLLPSFNPTLSNLGPLNPVPLSPQAISPINSIAQQSLLQLLYPIKGLPSVKTNLGPIDNNFLLNNINRNIKNIALSNAISASNTADVPSPDLINRLRPLKSSTPETLSSTSPEYIEYLNLISKFLSQAPLRVQQNPNFSKDYLATQLSYLNNISGVTGTNINLNSNPFFSLNPQSSAYSSLNTDSSVTTNILENTITTEISSDGDTSISTSTDSTETSVETSTETISTNPYAIPSIADLPNVLASKYPSLPQLYNNLYSQISPSDLIVPKIENLISTADLTKSITDLGNEIAKRYIDNLRTTKTKPIYPPLVYHPVPMLSTPNTVSSSTETISPQTNVSPEMPTQSCYLNNLSAQPQISSNFVELYKEVEQTYPFYPFLSLPQSNAQTEIPQGPILPTFYPAEISLYSPSVLPTPNINYPVYPPYIPTPPMNFPPIPPLFPPMPSIIETPILKMGSNGQDARRLIEILLLSGLLNNDCNDRGTLEALIALILAS